MLEFYQQLAQTLKQTSLVLATITNTKGSVPREIGAKMFICSDGTTFGTIGGGAQEATIINKALEILQTGEKQFVEIDLSGTAQRETQGICGGTMQVWLELWSGSEAVILVNQILSILTSNHPAAIITPFNIDKKPYLETAHIPNCPTLENNAFIEPLLSPPTLLIIGAGHIAVPLAQIAKIAGFQVIVQDDRLNFATTERFPDALDILAQPIAKIENILNKIPDIYVALVTRGYLQDLDALRLLENSQIKYLGMIGSKKRIHTVYQILKNEGYSKELLQKINAPIGLDIGALTPEEIAVSICAEIIKVRRGGSGISLHKI